MKTPGVKNIFCSVSAGYSSVMMAVLLREMYPDHRIVNVMANTSKEHKESLVFMDACDKYFDLKLHWVEADISPKKGVGTSFSKVSFKDLKINGEIYEEGIKKYGIPSQSNKWCNRELKLRPLKKYARHLFKKEAYVIALGIRSDEIDRVSSEFLTDNIFYPLIDLGVKTADRNNFWAKQPIKISIPAYKGNCDLCFEKSNRKLLTILKDDRSVGDWWQLMVERYGRAQLPGKKAYNDVMLKKGRQSFFRGYRDVNDLVELSLGDFNPATDEYIYISEELDKEGRCGSICSVFI